MARLPLDKPCLGRPKCPNSDLQRDPPLSSLDNPDRVHTCSVSQSLSHCLVTGDWSLVTGDWSLVTGDWSLLLLALLLVDDSLSS